MQGYHRGPLDLPPKPQPPQGEPGGWMQRVPKKGSRGDGGSSSWLHAYFMDWECMQPVAVISDVWM